MYTETVKKPIHYLYIAANLLIVNCYSFWVTYDQYLDNKQNLGKDDTFIIKGTVETTDHMIDLWRQGMFFQYLRRT